MDDYAPKHRSDWTPRIGAGLPYNPNHAEKSRLARFKEGDDSLSHTRCNILKPMPGPCPYHDPAGYAARGRRHAAPPPPPPPAEFY